MFQSTPSGGKATIVVAEHRYGDWEFQSTPSGGKATKLQCSLDDPQRVSIHAFRGEGDLGPKMFYNTYKVSIHAFRGEGDVACRTAPSTNRVSIHAFRGEGDRVTLGIRRARQIVSIHAFRGEGDRNI